MVDEQEPFAWYGCATRADGGYCKSLDWSRESVERELTENAKLVVEIVPLYRSPTLTDAEREAIRSGEALLWKSGVKDKAATLRALMGRMVGRLKTNHDAEPAAIATFCDDSRPQAASELGNPVRNLPQNGTGNTHHTFTAEQRESIRKAAEAYEFNDDDPECMQIANDLRSLLERA